MSNILTVACWPLQMPPTAKAVLMSLADNANDQGECWPSINNIAKRTCFGRTAVIEAIRWIERAKLLKADRSNGRHTRYRLTPESFVAGNPVREAYRSASRTGTGDVLDQSTSRTTPVRQADTIAPASVCTLFDWTVVGDCCSAWGQINATENGWRVAFYREWLGEYLTIEDAKHAVFEWFAMNYPRG